MARESDEEFKARMERELAAERRRNEFNLEQSRKAAAEREAEDKRIAEIQAALAAGEITEEEARIAGGRRATGRDSCLVVVIAFGCVVGAVVKSACGM